MLDKIRGAGLKLKPSKCVVCRKQVTYLGHFVSDPTKTNRITGLKIILDTDTSDIGIGAVLSQIDKNGREGVIAYASRTPSKPERRYCVTR